MTQMLFIGLALLVAIRTLYTIFPILDNYYIW